MSHLSSTDILLTKPAEQLIIDLKNAQHRPSDFPDASLAQAKKAHMAAVQTIIELQTEIMVLAIKRDEIKGSTTNYRSSEEFMELDQKYNELLGSITIYLAAAQRYNRILLAFTENRRSDINQLLFQGIRSFSPEILAKLHTKEQDYINNTVSAIGDYLDHVDLPDDILTHGYIVPLPEMISCEIEYLEDDQRIYESDMSTATIKKGSTVRTHLNEIEEELCTGKAKMK